MRVLMFPERQIERLPRSLLRTETVGKSETKKKVKSKDNLLKITIHANK